MAQGYNFSTGEVIQRFSDNIIATTLAQDTEQHTTVPDFSTMGRSSSQNSQQIVAEFRFSPNSSVWVANNQTAAAAGSSFSASTSTLNPVKFVVKSGDILSFKTHDTAGSYVCVSYYQSL